MNAGKTRKTPSKTGKPAKSDGKVPEKREKVVGFGGISPKKLRFCEEYLIDCNALQAAIRAGYSARSAGVIGHELLKKTEVAAEIDRMKQARSIRTQITADRVLEELARLSFYDPEVIASAGVNCPADIAKLPEDARRAIIGWGWDKLGNFTLKLSDKKGPLEALGRHLALFTDNVSGKVELEHSGEVSHILEFGSPDDDYSDIPGA